MIRLAAVMLVSLGASHAAPATAPRPQQAPPDLRPAVVIGRVIDAASGGAVRRAIVRLEGGSQPVTRVADERGRFYFRGLPAGHYSITAMRDGYFDGAFGRVRAGGDALDLPLSPGEWRTDVEIPMFRPATIAGVVGDEASEPLTGVPVEALRREFTEDGETWLSVTRTQTNDLGAYRLTGLLPGEYVVVVPSVQASMPLATLEEVGRTGATTANIMAVFFMNGGPGSSTVGHPMPGMLFDDDEANGVMIGAAATPPASPDGTRVGYPTHFYPASDSVESAVPIALASGEARHGVNVILTPQPTARVTGRVEGPDGPVPGMLLRLIRHGAADSGVPATVAATVSAPDGSFALVGVPAGAYVLHARSAVVGLASVTRIRSMAPPAVAAETQPLLGPARLFAETPLAVFDRDVDDVIVTMTSGATLAGRVEFDGPGDAPPAEQRAGLHVRLRRSTGATADVPPLGVGPDDTFEFTGVRPGRYIVEAGGLPAGWFVSSVTQFGRDVLENPVDLGVGADAFEVIVTLTDRPAGIAGTVYDSMRRAQPGARVVAVPAGRAAGLDADAAPHTVRSVRASVYGLFTLLGLAPGAYDVVVLDDRADDRWRDARTLSETGSRPVRVTVAAGQVSPVSVLK
ncbi:MAG TPA: carboxypeptidase-like regulatory domain-containing protein [Vicinamibacterales bacterium]|nr:carboxypeptidase-like regulatory domain-containing protein [Vicinamibacterales bacterium]